MIIRLLVKDENSLLKSGKILFFYKEAERWIEIKFTEIKNIDNDTFLIAINIEMYNIRYLFIKHNNNFLVKLYRIDIHINDDIESYIDAFYLDCGLKWLFNNEYKIKNTLYTDTFPLII